HQALHRSTGTLRVAPGGRPPPTPNTTRLSTISRVYPPRGKRERRHYKYPEKAHGFGFDGAEFTHVEDRVTFDVLLTAFSLDGDPGLDGLARLVHYLDVGGGKPVVEAAGFEAVLTGLRDSCADDDALLVAVTPVLDALYQHFSHSKAE